MIDQSKIGYKFEPYTVDVEAGRLRFFAKAIGETNPIYTDDGAAKAAGYTALPAPPTFVYCLEMEKPDPFDMLKVLDIDIGKVLHGGQSFLYHKPIVAGDALTYSAEVTSIYDKKGGALEFVELLTTVTNQNDDKVAEMQSTIVVRN